MKTRLDKFFNIIKWAPIVLYVVLIVLSIIAEDYDVVGMILCLILVYGLLLSEWHTNNVTIELMETYKKAYEKECELFKEALMLRKEILDEAVNSKELAEDMLRIFNNVDKMYKRYGDNN